MYKSGHVRVKYNDTIYETDYLDWYKQAVHDGKVATPTWVIDINGGLDSDIDMGNDCFYPIYAVNINFTSSYLLKNQVPGVIGQMMGHNENVMVKPVLVVIPHGSCFGTLSDYQRRQLQVPIAIKKFMNCNTVLMNHSKFDFVNAVINHVELLNGDEIAVIFTSYQIVIQERIWKNDGTMAGSVRKDLNYNTLGGDLQAGFTLVKDLI